jgi:hypothetical protein
VQRLKSGVTCFVQVLHLLLHGLLHMPLGKALASFSCIHACAANEAVRHLLYAGIAPAAAWAAAQAAGRITAGLLVMRSCMCSD